MSLPGQLRGLNRAGIGQLAVWLDLNCALLLPLGKILQILGGGGILHPLDDLKFSDKINIRIGVEDVGHPVINDIIETSVIVWPGVVKRQAKGSLVGSIVMFKVVLKKLSK